MEIEYDFCKIFTVHKRRSVQTKVTGVRHKNQFGIVRKEIDDFGLIIQRSPLL